MLAIHAGRILLPGELLHDGMLIIEDGRIAALGARTTFADPLPMPLLDASDLLAAPGFIDLHTHGGGGGHPIAGSRDALAQMAAFYASHGVTGFLASAWGKARNIEVALDLAVDALQTPSAPSGAAILGIYLEGPFLSPQWPGAFEPASIVAPNPALLASYIARAAGHLRLLTLAPEVAGAAALIRMAQNADIVVAAGHTGATYNEMRHAAELGVRHATHMFNAMAPLHHRTPNATGAILADSRFTAEIIADGIHVHPAVVNILVRHKGAENVALITDSIRAAGLPDGTYHMEDGDILVQNGSARLADGTLAGSLLTMDQGLANLIAFGACNLAEASIMASATPARILGMDGHKGALARGYDADLVLLDAEMQVVHTIVGGNLVYSR